MVPLGIYAANAPLPGNSGAITVKAMAAMLLGTATSPNDHDWQVVAAAVPEEGSISPAIRLDLQVKVSSASLNSELSEGTREENFAGEERKSELCPTRERAKRGIDAL